MDLSRREILAGAALCASPWLMPGAARAAATSSATFAPAVERVRAFAESVLAYNGFPGVSLALIGPDDFSAALAAGFSDAARGVPASPHQLFQIGSITKSLTAMALFLLAERGRVDLSAQIQDLLPEYPLPAEPISLRHLLDHSSGLPNSTERSGFVVVPGGRLWTGFPPGSRFSYCNLGFALVGAVVERASGLAFPRALRTLVLEPIGMGGARPTVRAADREAFAVGHVPLRGDVPWLPGARLTAAPWMEFNHPAGSVAASANHMIPYLRRIVEIGRGHGAPLFSDALADRFRTPTIDAPSGGPGARYANGLYTRDVGGRPCLMHSGGTTGFTSYFTVDPEAGVGCFASINVDDARGYRPFEITEYGVALLRAAAAGTPLPDMPRPQQRGAIREPARVIGRWVGASGREFVIREAAGAVEIESGGLARPLVSFNGFATDHPLLAPHVLSFEPGETQLLRLGNVLFGRDRAPAMPPVSPRLEPLTGFYFSAAEHRRANVYAVGDRLYLGTNALAESADGSWRAIDPAGASERIWFEHVANGRPQHLNYSGLRFVRQPES